MVKPEGIVLFLGVPNFLAIPVGTFSFLQCITEAKIMCPVGQQICGVIYVGAVGCDGSPLSMPRQVYTKALCVIEVGINLLHFESLCGWHVFLMPIMMRNKVINSLAHSCLAQGCDSEQGDLLFASFHTYLASTGQVSLLRKNFPPRCHPFL